MSKKGKPSAVDDDDQALAELRASGDGWVAAIEAHRMAPPDAGFSTRLARLAMAAGEQARVYFDGPADRDLSLLTLGAATEGEDMIEVADAYEDLAAAAAELSKAIEREDAASSQRPRTRARVSA